MTDLFERAPESDKISFQIAVSKKAAIMAKFVTVKKFGERTSPLVGKRKRPVVLLWDSKTDVFECFSSRNVFSTFLCTCWNC